MLSLYVSQVVAASTISTTTIAAAAAAPTHVRSFVRFTIENKPYKQSINLLNLIAPGKSSSHVQIITLVACFVLLKRTIQEELTKSIQ